MNSQPHECLPSLHTQEVDFDMITRSRVWYMFASTARLYRELCKPDSTRLAGMAVRFEPGEEKRCRRNGGGAGAQKYGKALP